MFRGLADIAAGRLRGRLRFRGRAAVAGVFRLENVNPIAVDADFSSGAERDGPHGFRQIGIVQVNIHGLKRRVAVPHQRFDIGLALQHRDDGVQVAAGNVKADCLAGRVRDGLGQG